METPLDEAIRIAGGGAALARQLGVTPQAVYQWPQCPADRAREVERLTGVSVHLLRPDIFGPPSPQPVEVAA